MKRIIDAKFPVLKTLLKNKSFFLLFVYIIGYTNLYIYYSCFNVPITKYIGLNDMLSISIEIFLKTFFLFSLITILIELICVISYKFFFIRYSIFFIKKKGKFYVFSSSSDKAKIHLLYHKYYDKYSNIIKFIVALVMCFIFIGCFTVISSHTNFLNQGNYDLYQLLSLTLSAFGIYLLFLFEKININDRKNELIVFAALLVLMYSVMTTPFSVYQKRTFKDNFSISFIENNKYISTDENLCHTNYLGETSSYIFLYEIDSGMTKIYNKENITSIKIKNTKDIDRLFSFIKLFRKLMQPQFRPQKSK